MKEGVNRLLAIILTIVLFAVSLVTALSMLELDNLSASAGNVITSNTPEYFEGYGENLSDSEIHTKTRLTSKTNAAPAITVFVHGQGESALTWANEKTEKSRNFIYDENSLIEKLRDDAGGANVYWAKMSKDENGNSYDDNYTRGGTDENNEFYSYEKNRFFLTELDDGHYETNKAEPESQKFITEITDVTKHTIIVFESGMPNSYHRDVANELHTVIDRISYDFLILTGEIPKVNLISHSRGGITSMMYATGYRENSKIDKVEYIYSDSAVSGYTDVGDGMYEKNMSYSSNGTLINDHPYNVSELYSLGSPYNGTKLDQSWAREIVQAFNNPSAKNITDEEIQLEIRNNWNAACVKNSDLALYANAGEISLTYLIGLLGEEREKIADYIGENWNIIDGICSALAYEWIPAFQSILSLIQAGCAAGAGISIVLPTPLNFITLITSGAISAACAVLQSNAAYIQNQAIAVCNTKDTSQKLLILDQTILSYYDLLNSFVLDILGVATSSLTGVSSIGDFGDLFVSTDSQLATGFNNTIQYKKVFFYEGIEISNNGNELVFDYNYRNFDITKTIQDNVAIIHNLETYDVELQNKIRDTIELEKLDYLKHLDISLVPGSTTGNWKVKIKNNNSITGTIVYNERMCFEGDAKNFHHLTNLRSFKLSPKGERIVTITGNGTACFIAISVSYFLPSGKSINAVTYADGLDAGKLTMNPPKQNIVPNGERGNVDLVPNYLDLKITTKVGATWKIKLINSNDEDISVTYNSKMCFDDAARNFYGLRDLVDITVPANSYREVEITENGFACFITAAINYVVDGTRYRRISSADGLSTSGNMNDIRHHEVVIASSFPEVSSHPSYVTMTPTSRSGFIFYTWGIRIQNDNPFDVKVSYNSKLCFKGDAENFNNLGDIVSIVIPARSSKNVTINHNGTAGWIVASINYSYNGYEYRRITYADGLDVNPYRTHELQYNEIRYS